MDGNGGIVLRTFPLAATGESGTATSGKLAPSPVSARKGTGTRPSQHVEVQKVIREALKIEPLPDRELHIEFEIDLHRFVVKVMDKESGEIIRQIPMPEELAVAKNIRAQLGRMVREQRAIAVDQEI